MKELKSVKTGRVQLISEEDFAEITNKGVIDLRRFIITDVKSRPIIPSLKPPIEVEKLPKKKI